MRRRAFTVHRRDAVGVQFESLDVEPWMAKGSCAYADHPDDWFPTQGDLDTGRCWQVFETCRICPVRGECLDYVLNYPGLPLKGIWAGTTYEQRKPLLHPRQRKHHYKRGGKDFTV